MELRLCDLIVSGLPAEAGIQEIFGILAKDEARNRRICQDIMEAYGEGRKVIVLTERSEHMEALRVLHGRMSRRQRGLVIKALEALPDGEPRLILATRRLAGEGFDDAPLDTLALAHVAYARPPLSREERASKAKVVITRQFTPKQQLFLGFVLSLYVTVGVEELAAEKLSPLLRLKYDSMYDAELDLGKPTEIGKIFAGFQKYLYQRRAEVA